MLFNKNRKPSPDINEASNEDNARPCKYDRIPIWCYVLIGFCVVCGIMYLVMCISQPFADFFNSTVGHASRFLLAKITSILPFSLAEALILLSPVILVLVIRYFVKKRCATRKQTLVSVVCILSVASAFLSCFVLTFAAGYRGYSLDKKLGLERNKVSAKELYDSAVYLVEKIDGLDDGITFGEDGFSVMPYDLNTLNEKLIQAYASYSSDHSFIQSYYSRLKPVLLSEAMSYAHITGVYTFFTGESNLNVNFPDYSIPHTAAHELAHQRGIAREDEANMIAFLVCLESDDEYVQYCAYLNMFEYVISALTKADRDLAREVWRMLPENVYREELAYSSFFKKYQDSVTSQVSGAVNDAYLKGQGTEGQKSYGMVVDLTVAYLKSEGLIP